MFLFISPLANKIQEHLSRQVTLQFNGKLQFAMARAISESLYDNDRQDCIFKYNDTSALLCLRSGNCEGGLPPPLPLITHSSNLV